MRRDHLGRCRGGIAVLIEDGLQVKVVTVDGNDHRFELLWVKVLIHDGALFLGALYHPPKPIYPTAELVNWLEITAEEIAKADHTVIIILCGELNQLADDSVNEATGLSQLVHQSTRGNSSLDRLYVSANCYETVKIVQSLFIKSDHKAIVAIPSCPVANRQKKLTRVAYRCRSPQQHALLLQALSQSNFDDIMATNDPQEA